MQTFIPSPLFVQSAAVLDDARLRKQQVEAEQILNVLRNPTPKGWANHPAVLQWKGYEFGLQCYLNAISKECIRRGFKGRHDGQVECWGNDRPWWIGDDRIHESHRSRLLFKGRVDAACSALKNDGVKKVNDWLVSRGYPVKNQFKSQDIIDLEMFLSRRGVIIPQNHYRQFWPDLDDTIPYVWPVTKETYGK